MRAKLVNEEMEDQYMGPRLHRDSKVDWSQEEENYKKELETPSVNPAGEHFSKGFNEDEWFDKVRNGLYDIFNEDYENMYILYDLIENRLYNLEKQGKTPLEAINIISNNKKLMDEWKKIHN